MARGVIKRNVMVKDGLPNFQTDGVAIMLINLNEEKITFTNGLKRDKEKTVTLPFYKLLSVEMGEKGNTAVGSGTKGAVVGGLLAGSTGAIIGSTRGKKALFTPTLKIVYNTIENDENVVIKEINLYQCPYYSEGSINYINLVLAKYLAESNNAEQHIEL
ncbi:MAG: hypothetical protein RSA49_00240 [Anaerovoracaceae bacterium]